MPDPKRIAVLASHGGTNAQAVIDACRDGLINGTVCVVISNNSTAMVLERARQAGIPTRHLSGTTHPDPADLDQAILGELRERGADLVVLAGYMKQLGPATIAAFDHRIVNIHPSLLPRYGGRGMYGARVHEAVLAAGDGVTGVSVHLVDEHYDHGPVIAQQEVPVVAGDTPETLASRVLSIEHEVLVAALARLTRGDAPATQ